MKVKSSKPPGKPYRTQERQPYKWRREKGEMQRRRDGSVSGKHLTPADILSGIIEPGHLLSKHSTAVTRQRCHCVHHRVVDDVPGRIRTSDFVNKSEEAKTPLWIAIPFSRIFTYSQEDNIAGY
ncbi:hypothetical protein E5288_WYG017938 [Bos mutus]|uniref:Uncharacterized protein n=1 Tax=Bos mutus TaxID=72004 RepID=A0A6B0S0V0_9CETA|nr:hypothetical protein [Bos mutus]